MPAHPAALVHGNRGGGWIPPKSARPAAAPKQEADPTCGVCGRRYSAHSGDLCPVCRHPVEHHDPAATAACWAGRARMAAARRAAGLDLNAVDVEALERAR